MKTRFQYILKQFVSMSFIEATCAEAENSSSCFPWVVLDMLGGYHVPYSSSYVFFCARELKKSNGHRYDICLFVLSTFSSNEQMVLRMIGNSCCDRTMAVSDVYRRLLSDLPHCINDGLSIWI